ncbi:unnamed protein product, partial [Meganyctiphanes norvegica]
MEVFVNATDYRPVVFLNASGSVKGKLVVVEIGKDVWLNCSAGGNPTPSVTWYKNGLRINSSLTDPQKLYFERVIDEDSGNYTCEAQNHRDSKTYKPIHRIVILKVVLPSSKGLIAGLIATGVLIFIMVFVVMKLFWRVKKEVQFRSSFRENELYLFEKGNVGELNNDCTADEQAQLLPYDRIWEVPKQDIEFG